VPTRPFEFENSEGVRLAGRLELPAGPARSWALFAHCFTCGKDNRAAVRIARRLAGVGIGVLRFDFTGLGQSEGDFAESTFALNVKDLVAATAAMERAGFPPMLMLGHSLGGAAVLAAAAHVPTIRAFATIAAPFDTDHLLEQFTPSSLAEIEANGRAMVPLGGRPMMVGKTLVEGLRDQDQGERIANLRRPLLIMHSPTDQVVGIDNVTRIYLAARHPKSFVSIDGADHLLSAAPDADFVADVIGTWASRYLPEPAAVEAAEYDAEAEETGLGKFQLAMRAGQASFIADEPASVGGLGSGPTPFNLLSAALAACTTMTLRLYAVSKNLPVDRIRTSVSHRKDDPDKPDIFSRRITIDGEIDADQQNAMIAAADRCPVHKTLSRGSRFDPAVSDDRTVVQSPA
jgi:putative redox protein